MSFEQTVTDAVERAFQKAVLPLLQPVLEQMKFVSVPKKEVEELWDTRQVARFLKLAPITVEMWRPEGRGPSFLRIAGNRIRYRKSDVITFAEANKTLLGRKGRPPQELVEVVRQSGVVVDGCHSAAGRARRSAKSSAGE